MRQTDATRQSNLMWIASKLKRREEAVRRSPEQRLQAATSRGGSRTRAASCDVELVCRL
jgi:hypothetical protein